MSRHARIAVEWTRVLTVLAVVAASLVAELPAAAQDAGPASYTNSRFGYTLVVPAILRAAGEGSDDGRIWTSQDGRARLIASAMGNAAADSLAAYRRHVIAESYADAAITYSPMRDSWFVLSGRKGDLIFYERATFACGGRFIYGWLITYPADQRRTYDPIVEEIARSYRPGRGEDGNCR